MGLRPLGLPDVLGELLDVRRERGRRIDREVDHDLGAERLAQGHRALEGPAVCRLAGELVVLEILGPDAEHDLAALVAPERRPLAQSLLAELDLLRARHHLHRPVVALQRRLEHVHRRAADEAGDEEIDRMVVELLRIGRLL